MTAQASFLHGSTPDLYLGIGSPALLDAVLRRGDLHEIHEQVRGQVPWLSELRLRGFYFGSITCHRLLPTRDQLDSVLDLARRTDLAPVMVTPVVPQSALAQVQNLLLHLEHASTGMAVGVEANDWGILSFLGKSCRTLRPLLGRFLQQTDSDRRVDMTSHPDFVKVLGAYRQNATSIARHGELLRSLGVERVELELLPQGPAIPPPGAGLQASLHMPFVVQTASRRCIIGSMGSLSTRGKFLLDGPCQRQCLDYLARYVVPRPGTSSIDYIQVGRVVLYQVPVADAKALRQRYLDTAVGRVVYSPALPF